MTFAQRRNRRTMHFSESIPVVKRHISVLASTNARPRQTKGDHTGHALSTYDGEDHSPSNRGSHPWRSEYPTISFSNTRWDAIRYYRHSRNEPDPTTHDKQHRKPRRDTTTSNVTIEDLATHKSTRFSLIFSISVWPRHLPSHFLPSNIHVLSKHHNFNKWPN